MSEHFPYRSDPTQPPELPKRPLSKAGRVLGAIAGALVGLALAGAVIAHAGSPDSPLLGLLALLGLFGGGFAGERLLGRLFARPAPGSARPPVYGPGGAVVGDPQPTSVGRMLWIGWCALWALFWGFTLVVGNLFALLLVPASILLMFVGRPRRVLVVNAPGAWPPPPASPGQPQLPPGPGYTPPNGW